MGRGISFGENLAKEYQDKESLLAIANKYFMSETLSPELERIYTKRKKTHAFGHPVHYFVETDNPDTRREIYKAILNALYTNFRLDSRRYTFLDFRLGESYSKAAYETLYKVSYGGAIVVRYLAGNDAEDGAHASGER